MMYSSKQILYAAIVEEGGKAKKEKYVEECSFFFFFFPVNWVYLFALFSLLYFVCIHNITAEMFPEKYKYE